MSAISKTNIKQLPKINRRLIDLSHEDLVKTGRLQPGKEHLLVIEPVIDHLDFATWAGHNRQFIEDSLRQYGGILFRGGEVKTQQDFERFLSSISAQLMNYIEGATPRTSLGNHVYTSTEYPSDQSIAVHNELSYVTAWPTRIWFFCITPAEQGGETPVSDVRRVFANLEPTIVKQFTEKGWMLVRNFGTSLSLPWQQAFRTTSISEVTEYCRAADIHFEWKGGDRVTTRQVRPAIAKHPQTGETVWFNHVAFWHISSLSTDVRSAMLELLGEDGLPYNTYYGDGSPIEAGVVEAIREAYRRETVEVNWQKGDLLMLDNMLLAHGRNPYQGPRKILAAMGEPCSDRGVL